MSSPEQLPDVFLDFFKENPGLFEPLREIPDTEVNQLTAVSSEYEPVNENERRLLAVVKDHIAKAGEAVIKGRFNLMEVSRSPVGVLTVYSEILGRVLGRPLEGGVRVGVNTGIRVPNEFDGTYNVFVIINSEGSIDRMVTNLGSIYPDLLEDRDKSFLEEHYFPVSKLAQIIQPHLKRK